MGVWELMDMDTGLDTTDTVWDTMALPTVAMRMLVTTMPTQPVLSTLPSVPLMPSQQLTLMPMPTLTTMVSGMVFTDMLVDMVLDTLDFMVMDMVLDTLDIILESVGAMTSQ